MAKNLVQDGDVLTLTAPVGGVISGNLYIIGGIAVVALVTAAAGVKFAAARKGVFTLPKATGANTDLTEGVTVFWDAANNQVKRVSATGLRVIGVAIEAAATTDATGKVAINLQPLPAVVP
jgi:predicted RecA/RadA family phage recombinase